MKEWKSIENIDPSAPIWVLKYDLYCKDGEFCKPDEPGSVKFTDCHGWYETEADALKVLCHFREPNSYRIEKIYKRVLKVESTQ